MDGLEHNSRSVAVAPVGSFFAPPFTAFFRQLTPVDLHVRKRIGFWSGKSQKSGVLDKVLADKGLSLFVLWRKRAWKAKEGLSRGKRCSFAR